MTKPISPDEVADRKAENIPGEVYEAFNEMIAKKWNGHSAVLLQKDVANLARQKLGAERGALLYENGWMDVEDAYRKMGWVVVYDKPGYNETYEASFTFTKKRMR